MENLKPLKIVITPENRPEFEDIQMIVRTYIQMHRDIPPAIISRLYEIMYDENKYKINQIYDEQEKQASIAVAKIKKMTGYQLVWEKRLIAETDVTFMPDTKNIFSALIRAFYHYSEVNPKAGKDEAIAFFYCLFDEEFKSQMEPDSQSSFTPYKQAVVSGILAMAIGYILVSNSDPTNEEIYQATRNAIKKYKTREDFL